MSSTRSLLWSLGTIMVAAVVSFAIARWAVQSKVDSHRHGHAHNEEQGFHDWLHENLGISAEQEALLYPTEVAFEENRERLHREIEAVGVQLAGALRSHGPQSPELASARKSLNALQGELQQITLDHFFAMKAHLTPEQGEKLLDWTQHSITDGNHTR